MNTALLILSGLLIAADLIICMVIAKVTAHNSKNEQDYFIGGKSTGPFLLFLTAWASFSGAGNFIGQAGRGALYGQAHRSWESPMLCSRHLASTTVLRLLSAVLY